LVFRGAAQLRVLYLGQDGRVHTYDADIPLSQYAQLEKEYGEGVQAKISPMVTEIEIEKTGNERMGLKAVLVGQYVVCEERIVSAVEDAFSNLRTVELQQETLELPALLEECDLSFPMETALPAEAVKTVDCMVMASHPRLYCVDDGMVAECEGAAQVLYYDGDGQLRCDMTAWEVQENLKADDSAKLMLSICEEPMASVTLREGEALIRADMPLRLRTMQGQGIMIASGMSVGEEREPDPERPSLILRRVGERSLWELAKESGSTVAAIRAANGLEGEPEPGRMLLIPVC
jgi:hypothetical protein